MPLAEGGPIPGATRRGDRARRARAETKINWIASNAVPIRRIAAGSGFPTSRRSSRFPRGAHRGVGEATHAPTSSSSSSTDASSFSRS